MAILLLKTIIWAHDPTGWQAVVVLTDDIFASTPSVRFQQMIRRKRQHCRKFLIREMLSQKNFPGREFRELWSGSVRIEEPTDEGAWQRQKVPTVVLDSHCIRHYLPAYGSDLLPRHIIVSGYPISFRRMLGDVGYNDYIFLSLQLLCLP